MYPWVILWGIIQSPIFKFVLAVAVIVYVVGKLSEKRRLRKLELDADKARYNLAQRIMAYSIGRRNQNGSTQS